MKNSRQEKIIELITKFDIETQEELCAKLSEEGYNVTQATISRDIRALNLIKKSTDNKRQKYSVNIAADESNIKYQRIIYDGVVSMDTAQNILVIKTRAGMAMAVAAAIDNLNIEKIIGSIAGDDTIMAACKTTEDAEFVYGILNN